MKFFITSFFLGLAILNGCSKSHVTDDSANLNPTGVLVRLDELSCVTPWGETIHSGETRKGFKKNMLASCTDNCDSVSGDLVCTNGTLSGTSDYIYDRCDKPKCSCTLSFLDGKPTLKHGDWISLYRQNQVQCGSCASVLEQRQCQDGTLTGSTAATLTACQEIPCKDCVINPTLTVTNNHSAKFYKSTSGQHCSATASCAGQELDRTCTNGILSGDTIYSQTSCTDQKCGCTYGTRTVTDGTSIDYYTNGNGTCAQKCQAVKKSAICNDGTINGLSNPNYPICNDQNCDCNFKTTDGVNLLILNTQSAQTYMANSPSCGGTCAATTLSCSQGNLSGDQSYKYSYCNVQNCTCTTPWGNPVIAQPSTSPGSGTLFYQHNTSVCGQSKCSTYVGNTQTYYCVVKGSKTYWADGNGNTVTNFGAFQYGSCNDPVCTCQVAGKSINQGSSISAYKQNSVACGDVCDGLGKSINIQCNSDLSTTILPSGSDPASFFSGTTYDNCTVASCPGSTGDPTSSGGGTGTSVPGSGGGSGGGVGDGNGPGIHFTGRPDSGSGGGGPGSNFLEFDTLSLAPMGAGCTLPWGGAVTHLATVNSFTIQQAPSGQKCSTYRKQLVCIDGKLRPTLPAVYLNCQESK